MQKTKRRGKVREMFRKRLLTVGIGLSLLAASLLICVSPALAAAGISPSGGGKFVTGQTFTITVRASGATFDSLQGTIRVSGAASVVSFGSGGATWLPGKSPSNGGQFVGIVSATSSLTVATIKLRSDKEGSGSVSVSGVRLARSGQEVGSSGGSTSYSISRAPTPPGDMKISSTTHPNQEESYGLTTAELSWEPPANGANGYSTLLDEVADTVPLETVTTTETTAKYEDLALGTHYFHLRAHNSDGWGPANHFRINVKEAVDETLTPPTILSAVKTADFKTDLEKGTVSGFQIVGASTGLTDFQLLLNVSPADKLPAEQKLTVPISADGSWQMSFDQMVPSGFYKIMAQAKKDKSITPESPPAYLEVSVANGGTAKLITSDDLQKPDLSVTVAGVTFSTKQSLWWALALVVLFAFAVTGVAYVARQMYKRWKAKRKAQPERTKPSSIPN